MAKAVLVLEVDAAAGKAEVKAFGKEFETALDRIAARAGAVGTQTEAATAKLNTMLHNIPGHVQPAEAAFQSLGLRSSTAIEQARSRITTAYDTIKNSGTASAADVMRAHEAQEKALKKLSDEAMPNLIGKQKAGAASSSEYAGTLGKVDEWLNKAGINTGFFGKAIGALVSPVTLAAVAVAGLVAFTSAGVSATVEAVKEAKNLAVVSGLSAEKADNLTGTMKLLGVESGVTQGAMFRLAQEVDSGASGLTRLGIEVRKTNGEFKTEGELFLEVRDRISQLGSASERNAALTDIFGRSGRALAGAFSLSREEFQRWMDKVGGISSMTDETVKKTSEYTRAVAELEQRFDALKQTVGTGVIPTLSRFLGLLNEALDKAKTPIVVDVRFRLPGPASAWDYLDALNRPPSTRPPGRAAAETPFPESGTTLPDQSGPRSRRLTDTELQAQRLAAQGRFNATTQGLDREAALRQQSVALGSTTESQALVDELAALGRRQAATQAYYADLRRLAAERPDYERNNVKEIELAESAALNAIVVQRTTVQQRLQVMGRDYTTTAAEEAIRRNVVERDQAEKTAAFTRDVTAQLLTSRIGAFGTEEEKFIRGEQEKLDAFERRQYEQANLDGDYLGAYARVQEEIGNSHQRVQNEIRKQDGITATAHAKALHDRVLATETAADKIQREYRAEFNALDHLRANQLISRRDFDARVQRLEEDTRTKGLHADQAELQRQLANLTTRNSAEQQSAALRAQVRQQERQAVGDLGGFIVATFQLAAASGQSAWQGLAGLITSTVAGAQRALSDFLFNFITGTATAAEAFKQFGLSMLRTITDFLAQQAVRTFLQMLFGGGSGGTKFAEGGIAGVGSLGGGGTDVIRALLSPGESILSADVTKKALAGDFSGVVDTFASFGGKTADFFGFGAEGASGLSKIQQFFANPSDAFSSSSAMTNFNLAGGGAAGVEAGLFGMNAAQLDSAIAATQGAEFATANLMGAESAGLISSGGLTSTSGAGVASLAGLGAVAGLALTLATTESGSPQQAAGIAASVSTLIALGAGLTSIAASGVGLLVAAPLILGALFGKKDTGWDRPEEVNANITGQLLAQMTGKVLDTRSTSSILGMLGDPMSTMRTMSAWGKDPAQFAGQMAFSGTSLADLLAGKLSIEVPTPLGTRALDELTARIITEQVRMVHAVETGDRLAAVAASARLHEAIPTRTVDEGGQQAPVFEAANLHAAVFENDFWVDPIQRFQDAAPVYDWTQNGTVSSFDRGGIARVHNGEVMTPEPFADEFPALSRALARHDFSRFLERAGAYGDDGGALGPLPSRRGAAGADVRELVAEVRAMRRELASTMAAVANRPVIVKVGQRAIFETVRDAGKDAVKNGEQWISQRAVHPEKA